MTPFPRFALLAAAALVTAGILSPATATAAEAARAPLAMLDSDEPRFDPQALELAAIQALREAAQKLSGRNTLEVEIVDLRAVPDSIASLTIDGVGRVRLDRGAWIPMRFSAGYDLEGEGVFGLRTRPIASVATTSETALEAGLEERIHGQVAARILSEFPDQPIEIVFLELQPTSAAREHLSMSGVGLVDFADEGAAPVSFSAVLDRESGLLVALDYVFEVVGAHGADKDVEGIASN
jgi:hypothetical protein